MWKPFVHQRTNYLYKITTNKRENDDIDESIIYLTDCKCLWSKNQADIITKFKTENPLFQANDEETYAVLRKLLVNEGNIQSLDMGDGYVCVGYKGNVEDLPIKFTLELLNQGQDVFYELITVPMIKTIQFLELKHSKLESLLNLKDKEIEEYTLQFGLINRQALVTDKYQSNSSSSKTDVMLDIFSERENFLNNFNELHGDIRDSNPEIKEDKVVKRELRLAPLKKKRKH